MIFWFSDGLASAPIFWFSGFAPGGGGVSGTGSGEDLNIALYRMAIELVQ